MNIRNLAILAVVVAAMAYSFFSGGYAARVPVVFIAGLCIAIIISSWIALKLDTPSLVVFLFFATLVAAIDEYAHSSAGTLMYFDHGIPSFLTVSGWGIFMLVILFTAGLLMKIPVFASVKNIVDERGVIRMIPVLIPCILIALSVPVLGYVPVFTILLVLVYLLLAGAALYYARRQPVAWNVSVLIAGILTGGLMEYLGARDGIWTFHYSEPISLFILLSWPLRIWTVLCLCFLFRYDIFRTYAVSAG